LRWLTAFEYGAYRLTVSLVKAVRRALRRKPCTHGVSGPCRSCEAEAEQRLDEEFVKSPIGKELARQERLRKIYNEYSAIETETRELLKAKAEDRIRRFDLMNKPGDIEAAVVRMYRRSQRNDSSK
jgi:hypothetical protein